MSLRTLIGAALHPGTSLKHNGEKVVPVDALHALAVAPLEGSILLHARLGEDNLKQLKIVVKFVAMEIFAQREWTVFGRRMSPDQRMDLFVEQVWREYMGEPCRNCKGHGYIGRKLDLVRHKLKGCGGCHGSGWVLNPSGLKAVCTTCRGKTLVTVTEELKAGRLRTCPACWGSGSVPATIRARARALHYDHQQIRRVWLERFRAVLMTLREHERNALIICREQLYGAE